MDQYSILVPGYTIGRDAYSQIEHFCLPYGRKAVVIGGEKAMAAARQKLKEAVIAAWPQLKSLSVSSFLIDF